MSQAARVDLAPYLPAGAREFDPHREDRAAWARFHALRLAVHLEGWPEDRPEPDAVAEAGLQREEPFYERRHFLLEREGRALSRLFLSSVLPGTPEYESGRHHVWIGIEVHPDERRRRLASAWLPAAAAYARSRRARLLSCDSDHTAGQAFAESLGAEARHRAWQSRLWLDRADWARIREWAAIDAGGVRVERYEPFPPESIWEVYSRSYTELERHVPREQLEVGDWILTPERMRFFRDRLKAQHKTLHALAAWDAEGLAAVTELVAAEHEPEALEQELTAVHPRARGRGLARLLKARLLLELRERLPAARFVRTYNAGSNDAMWAINQAMGFQRHRLDIGYQLPVAALRLS